ncbi:MAG: sorbosone dehydrogenase [Hyphomicrobiales bacterium]|nr:sorbosone dehydrogenase [Hyphomicrobiales bacterium]
MQIRLILALVASCATASGAGAQVLTGAQAFGDVTQDRPGVIRKITPADLPRPGEGTKGSASSRLTPRPETAAPKAPEGFEVSLFASGLNNPRRLLVAPNGDVFVAETEAGRIVVLRAGTDRGKPQLEVFATGLGGPFGMAFQPARGEPAYLYVATTREILRFPYATGDLKARAAPVTIVKGLAGGGHSTRDLVFSADGKTIYVSVGSLSNNASGIGAGPSDLAKFERTHGAGAAWKSEEWRAAVLAFDADGSHRRAYATGLRNCAGLTMQPATGQLWCAVNERDMLGDNLPPEYVTSLREGGFYGWPWFYIGANQDPNHRKERPDLASKVVVPDVLIQAHSAPLGITFYEGDQFPAQYRGSAFVTLHGSWNRSRRTGYKVVRVLMANGKPTGEYEDFLTGFVGADDAIWGRPVGVTVARDGALLVSEDGSGTIWLVSARGK